MDYWTPGCVITGGLVGDGGLFLSFPGPGCRFWFCLLFILLCFVCVVSMILFLRKLLAVFLLFSYVQYVCLLSSLFLSMFVDK